MKIRIEIETTDNVHEIDGIIKNRVGERGLENRLVVDVWGAEGAFRQHDNGLICNINTLDTFTHKLNTIDSCKTCHFNLIIK